MMEGTSLNTPTQAQQVHPEDLTRGISAIRVLPHDDLDPMWDSIIVAEDNMERRPSQAILKIALLPRVALSGCVPCIGWSASVCGQQEVLHG